MANSNVALAEAKTFDELMYPSLYQKAATVQHISREKRNNELSVRTRRSSSYDPQNVRFGQLVLAPSVEVFSRYSDNIYAQSDNGESDYLYAVRPELTVASDLPIHQLLANFYYEDGSYNKLSEEDYKDYGAEIGARYDVYPGLAVPLAFAYRQNHARRDEPEDRRSIDPTVFTTTSGQTGLRLTGDFLEVNARTGFQDVQYDDTTSFAGTPIDNSGRDRKVYTHSLTVGFPQEALVAPFVYSSYRQTIYDVTRNALNIKRDSDDLEAGVGAFFGITGVTKSNFRVGYVTREFDDSSLDPIDALTYSFNLNWDATTLAAFNLSGKREIRETATISSAQLESEFELGLTYELFPNMLLKPKIGYLTRDYQQSDIKIKAYSAEMETLYKVSPNLWASLEYRGRNVEQEGSLDPADNDDYKENIVTLSLKFQL